MKSRSQILTTLRRKGRFGNKKGLSVSANYGMEALEAVMENRPLPQPVSWSVSRGTLWRGHWLPVPIETYDKIEDAVDAFISERDKEEE